MGIGDRVADPRVQEEAVERRRVATLGEPETSGLLAEDEAVMLDSRANLRPGGRQIGFGQWQEGVGRCGSDQFKPVFGESPEGREKIGVVSLEKTVASMEETVAVHAGEALVMGLSGGPGDLLMGERDAPLKMLHVTLLEQGVGEHRGERRRHRHRQAERDTIVDPALHEIEQGEVGVGDRLKEPELFKVMPVFGMPDEGQVCVEDDGEVPFLLIGRSAHRWA